VRLALAFSDSSKRDVKLDIAEERAHELEELTRRGRTIGPDVLDRIVEQTQPLINGADDGWDTSDVARLKAVADREQQALIDAKAQVDPEAQDNLEQAAVVSKQAADVAGRILVDRPDAQREVIALRFAVGLSIADTAKALGKREGNIKALQHKAVARLQKLLIPAPLGVESSKRI
jgi:DNA-directed RNA polymerase specialized sigma24 family protein